MTQEKMIDREVERLKEFSSFQQMARYVLGIKSSLDASRAEATWLDSLASLMRYGEGEMDEKELYDEYKDELKRIEERYNG